MRARHFIIAFCIVMLGHFMALYGITHIPENRQEVVTPPVIQATLITPPPEPVIEKPKPPKPVPPKETPPPPKEIKPAPKPPEPVVEPEKIISVDAPKTETANTLEVPPPPPEPEIVEEPVIPAKIDAKNKDNPPPDYPRMARRLGQEGSVVLEIYILADGSVGDVRVKKSSGFPRLDEAAMEAARKWHYTPAMRGNEPIDFWYSHSVKFVLN